MRPIKKICVRCENPFDASIPGQDECLQCMLKPQRSDDKQLPKELEMNKTANFAEKVCGCGCGAIFYPTGSRQKYRKQCVIERPDEVFRARVREKLGAGEAVSPRMEIMKGDPTKPTIEKRVSMVPEYDLIHSSDHFKFVAAVNLSLSKGWSLWGNVSILLDPSNPPYGMGFYQAVARSVPAKPEACPQ